MNVTSILRSVAGVCFRAAARVALIVVALPALYLIEPFYRIRLGLMYTQRIGHLAANTDVFLRTLKLEGAPKKTTYLLFGYDPCNRQLFRMFQKHLNIYESRWGTRLLFAFRPILKHTRFWQPLPFKGTEYALYNKTSAVLSFTEAEEEKGRALLREMGIGPDDWFVCFHARDNVYLHQWRPEFSDFWKDFDFRNCSIDNYLKAADFIASKGGHAIRMGAAVEKPLPDLGDPHIIDYATKHRSDFMDIYLAAKCRFFLGCSSGLAQVPTVFGKPVIVANHFPFNHTHYHSYDLVVPRLVVYPGTRDAVSFQDAIIAGFYEWGEDLRVSSTGKNMHLFDYLESSPDEILDACKDMLDYLEGREPGEESLAIQCEYAERYLNHLPDYQLAARISPRFGLRNRNLIIPGEETRDRT